MNTTLSTHQVQRGIVDLDAIKTAGREADFREHLAACFDQFNHRQNQRTNGDLLYCDVLGDTLAGLLGVDRETCRQQAKNYLEGSRAIVVLEALREFAAKLPRKGGNVRHVRQNAPANCYGAVTNSHAGVTNSTSELSPNLGGATLITTEEGAAP